MIFIRELVQNEIQTASSKFWIRISDSIFYDANDYMKHTLCGDKMYNRKYKKKNLKSKKPKRNERKKRW